MLWYFNAGFSYSEVKKHYSPFLQLTYIVKYLFTAVSGADVLNQVYKCCIIMIVD